MWTDSVARTTVTGMTDALVVGLLLGHNLAMPEAAKP